MFLPVGQDCGGSGTWVLQEAAAAVPDRLLSEAGRAPQTPVSYTHLTLPTTILV